MIIIILSTYFKSLKTSNKFYSFLLLHILNFSSERPNTKTILLGFLTDNLLMIKMLRNELIFPYSHLKFLKIFTLSFSCFIGNLLYYLIFLSLFCNNDISLELNSWQNIDFINTFFLIFIKTHSMSILIRFLWSICSWVRILIRINKLNIDNSTFFVLSLKSFQKSWLQYFVQE